MKYLLILILFFGIISCGNTTFDKIPQKALITSTKYLVVNPYGNSPLSAELRLSKPINSPLTITVKGNDGEQSDLSYTWNDSKRMIFPIVGMYFNSTNTIILSNNSNIKTLQVIITNKASSYIKDISILTNNRPFTEERRNFLNFFNPVDKLKDLFAIDNYGKIRWYFLSPDELHGMKFSEKNGEMIFSIINSVTPEVVYYNMVGKHLQTIKSPKVHSFNVPEADKRFHHEFFQRKNGNILVLDKSQYGVEDTILELDPKGSIVKEIQIGNWIRKSVNNDPNDYTGLENFIFDSKDNPHNEYGSKIRYPGMPKEQNAVDWAHINSINFDEDNNILYLSFRQHGIFAFDYKQEELKWIFSRTNYYIPTQNKTFYNLPDNILYIHQIPALAKYILKGANGPDFQHSITYLSNNQFMIFNNSGNDGAYPEEGSQLMIFTVNESNKTVSIDWEYKHKDQDNSYVYSQVVSDMDKTPFGSYIGLFGTRNPFTYIEISTNKQVLFDMRLDIQARSAGESDVALPIACPTSRLLQNGILLYRADYQSIYPNKVYSID